MRKKKAIINTLFATLQELVAVVSSFIIPRLILIHFGSTYNGITTSITQFLGYAVLLRAGIGGATRAALYKPIADGDTRAISGIMVATKKYMNKIALILLALIVGFSVIYPFFVLNEFDYLFSFSLFIIIGISTFIESLWGISNLILLQADQKLYISSIARIISTIFNTILVVVLIKADCSIHIVKLGSTTALCLYPMLLHGYVAKKYQIDYSVSADNAAISQRWDVFFHQVANFVMNNTDVMVLTIFSDIREVSVYSVYNLISQGIKKLVMNFTNGMEAAFGNMIAKKQTDTLKKNFDIIQFIIFSVATVVYTTATLVIIEFVSLYTKGVNDISYIRPAFAYLLMITQFITCVRQPYQLVVQAAGHYKQTKKGAIIEPVINIVTSVIAVIKLGLIGVICGTLVATIFRTVQFSVYVSKNLVKGSLKSFICLTILSVVESAAAILIYHLVPFHEATGYASWIIHGTTCMMIVGVIVLVVSLIFQRETLLNSIKKFVKKFK